jgi:TATA-box binding protein (TBP) (component of TFIID and TFIIIB)
METTYQEQWEALRRRAGWVIPFETPPEEVIQRAWEADMPCHTHLVNMVGGGLLRCWDMRQHVPVLGPDAVAALEMLTYNPGKMPAVTFRAVPQGSTQVFAGHVKWTGPSHRVALTMLLASAALQFQRAGCRGLYYAGNRFQVDNRVYVVRTYMCSVDLSRMAAAVPDIQYTPETYHGAYLRLASADGLREITVQICGTGCLVFLRAASEDVVTELTRLLLPVQLQYAGATLPRARAEGMSRCRARRNIVRPVRRR